jgi:hypothetical protein
MDTLKRMRTCVDTTQPDIPQTIGRNYKRFENELQRNETVTRDNRRLLGKMNDIQRQEHYPRAIPQRPYTLMGQTQKDEMWRITHENKKLLRAVQEKRPNLNRNDWLHHELDHEYQIAKMSEYMSTVPMGEIIRQESIRSSRRSRPATTGGGGRSRQDGQSYGQGSYASSRAHVEDDEGQSEPIPRYDKRPSTAGPAGPTVGRRSGEVDQSGSVPYVTQSVPKKEESLSDNQPTDSSPPSAQQAKSKEEESQSENPPSDSVAAPAQQATSKEEESQSESPPSDSIPPPAQQATSKEEESQSDPHVSDSGQSAPSVEAKDAQEGQGPIQDIIKDSIQAALPDGSTDEPHLDGDLIASALAGA